MTLRIQATAEQIRARLPASVASIEEAAADADPQAEGWLRIDLRAERLDCVPAVLASLDRPFVIERPDELRGLVIALAERLAASPAETDGFAAAYRLNVALSGITLRPLSGTSGREPGLIPIDGSRGRRQS